MRTIQLLIVAAALVAGARGASAAPDPTGTYCWEMYNRQAYAWLVDGADETVTGTLTIRRVAGGYAGTLTSSVGPEFPAKSVTVDGAHVLVVADTPYGEFRIVMTLGDDSILARWQLTGALAGTLEGPLLGMRGGP